MPKSRLEPAPATISLSPAAEEALFQRLLRRLAKAGQSAVAEAGNAVDTIAEVAGSVASSVRGAASAIGEAAGGAADQIVSQAKGAADFAQKHPGILALGSIGLPALGLPLATAITTALVARQIVERRRSGREPVAQLLFRAPESLRDEVKRLSVDEKRQMDELLIEGVLDLLIKYGRPSEVFDKVEHREP
jgi:hypothetical protein